MPKPKIRATRIDTHGSLALLLGGDIPLEPLSIPLLHPEAKGLLTHPELARDLAIDGAVARVAQPAALHLLDGKILDVGVVAGERRKGIGRQGICCRKPALRGPIRLVLRAVADGLGSGGGFEGSAAHFLAFQI
ncbi:hypothetical protein [Xanthobacter aminoxidans]|uniref:hypothetical protein n=1 Tax=Xanthobacter aminoxidans TaxID=186280 RepID=UPI002022FB4C|nr:hypothetical protein [Xanthobacter aminoxidans]MCL8385441.1 hypothetical protein [Xanthobacter aminoxidans]